MANEPDLKGLSAFFSAEEVEWKPQTVAGGVALAVAYIDARCVMDRLDEVLGPENWQDEYQILDDGCVVCRLSILVSGSWVTKCDVGAESEQKDHGDKRKASFSDAMKRAAVKWGVGRYLYSLPTQWVPYDQQKRQFTQQPQLPPWARPKQTQQPQPAQQKGSAPGNGGPVTYASPNQIEDIHRILHSLKRSWSAAFHFFEVVKPHGWSEPATEADAIDKLTGVLTAAQAERIISQLGKKVPA